MNYRYFLFALPLAVAACGGGDPEHTARPIPADGTEVLVAVEQISTVVPVAGTVRAKRRAEIATRMMARVSDVRVDVGSTVRSGQLLAVVGGADLDASRAQAEASVAAATAARNEAQRHLTRMEALLEQDAVPAVQRDGARLQLVQAESGLSMANGALAQVESQQSYSELKAPFSGRVVRRLADPGDIASPGMPLLVIEDLAREGIAHVPVDMVSALAVGAELRIESNGGREATAVVSRVAAGADPATRTVEVQFDLPAGWPTGSDLTAFVPQGTHEGVAVHESSVVRRGQLTGVRVATDNGVQLRWIRIGRSFVGADGITHFEVLSGLSRGDRIAQ